jgi:hypothetical protein
VADDDEENRRRAALFASSGHAQLNPPSAIARAVELGMAWAEDITDRTLVRVAVVDWPAWPPYDEAKPRARKHAAQLVADLPIHLQHRRPESEFRTSEARARQRGAADALVRLCYDAARTRYAELAAWRLT